MSSPRHRPTTDIDMHLPTYTLGKELQCDLDGALLDWRVNDKVRRLWARDATLWSRSDEAQWLGWLGIVEGQLAHLDRFADFAADVRDAGFTHVLLLGMGGSSLCPEVLSVTFGQQEGSPRLYVLDSTDPAQVKAFENKLDLAKTLFIVSSKSGSTLEPNIFKQYFFKRLEQTLGEGKAGAHFVAVTDPGSKLEEVARRDGYRHIFHGVPSIGGRYSALSHFGMIPAAAMGIDVSQVFSTAPTRWRLLVPPACRWNGTPGIVLGLILGLASKAGRDKLTLIASPSLCHLGAWLEQLLAESTGKQGRGIIPVDREPLGSPDGLWQRPRVHLPESRRPNRRSTECGRRDARKGRPAGGTPGSPRRLRSGCAVLLVGDRHRRRRFGARHQPLRSARRRGEQNRDPRDDRKVRIQRHAAGRDGVRASATAWPSSPTARTPLSLQAGVDATPTGLIKAHLARLGAGDYFALLGYVEMKPEHERILEGIRRIGARQQESRHLRRFRTSLSPLDRPGLQRRTEQRGIPPESPVTMPPTSMCQAGSTRSAS